MEKLLEKLKEIGSRILEWWNRFTTKQKTLIVCAAVAVVVAIVAIVAALTKPQYVLLRQCETMTEASEVKDLLDSDGNYTYQIADDGLTITVLKEQAADANFLLGTNNIQAAGYGIENVTDGSFSTTESDKQKKYVVYLQKYLENDVIKKFDAVKNALTASNFLMTSFSRYFWR